MRRYRKPPTFTGSNKTMQATTIRLVEKLMESQYEADAMFFEEEGAMTYCFTAYNYNGLEVSGTLHVYECSMRLNLEFYKKGENVPFKVRTEEITTFKDLTALIENVYPNDR